MKTVLVLASLVALTLSVAVPPPEREFEVESVDDVFVERQRKLFSLVKNVKQFYSDEEYYTLGKDYDIEANIENYTNKQAVEEFLALYKHGLMPKYHVFSVFYEKMREEAIALFHLFYYAKDFDTFYKSAAFARVHLNEGQFLYAYYIAVMHRSDTVDFVLPPPYEVFPSLYINAETINRINHVKMQNNIANPEMARQYGIMKENENYVFYSNYSNYLTYTDEEQRLSYFTEDIGLNSYYYYFHSQIPYWMEGSFLNVFKERRGEFVYMFYQRILARYYLERLANGLGEIPEFSWRTPLKNGFKPLMVNFYPFAQRTENYEMVTEENYENLRFLDAYEKNFLEFLEDGHFKAYNQEIDLHNSKAINFVGNYWQSNIDLYEKTQPRHYWRSYQDVARRVLGAAPEVYDKYTFLPSALDFYSTSMRDPAFFQLYSRITKYILDFKRYLEPYTAEQVRCDGVKVTDVKIDQLVTYFDFFDIDVTNGMYVTPEDKKTPAKSYIVRQPRLNHKPFSFEIDLKSDVTADLVIKIFMGPKYDSNGYPIPVEENWMNFVEMDWFTHKVVQGTNKVVRKSEDFVYFQEDLVSTPELYKLLAKNQVPSYERFTEMPERFMLPKGTKGGFPLQFVVVVYPSETVSAEYKALKFSDMKPLSYPFDRPINSVYFVQPNMYFKDAYVHHEGEEYVYKYNVPGYVPRHNEVPKN